MKQSLVIGLSIISILASSSVMAQHSVFVPIGTHPPPQPPQHTRQSPKQPQNPVIIVPAPTTQGFSETMVFGPNGQVTIIQQQGVDTFVTTSP